MLRGRYELKKQGNLGLDKNDDKHGVYLNRVVSIPEGKRYDPVVYVEPDSRRAQLVVRELGANAKAFRRATME